MARGLEHITGLPVIEYGFTGRTINLNNPITTPLGRWHFYHKPYQLDFDKSLLIREDKERKNESRRPCI